MAQEYVMRAYLTSKADVYSFRVVALEIISGKNGTSYRPNDESACLLDLVIKASLPLFSSALMILWHLV